MKFLKRAKDSKTQDIPKLPITKILHLTHKIQERLIRKPETDWLERQEIDPDLVEVAFGRDDLFHISFPKDLEMTNSSYFLNSIHKIPLAGEEVEQEQK